MQKLKKKQLTRFASGYQLFQIPSDFPQNGPGKSCNRSGKTEILRHVKLCISIIAFWLIGNNVQSKFTSYAIIIHLQLLNESMRKHCLGKSKIITLILSLKGRISCLNNTIQCGVWYNWIGLTSLSVATSITIFHDEPLKILPVIVQHKLAAKIMYLPSMYRRSIVSIVRFPGLTYGLYLPLTSGLSISWENM